MIKINFNEIIYFYFSSTSSKNTKVQGKIKIIFVYLSFLINNIVEQKRKIF
jgi:hypothetical protein